MIEIKKWHLVRSSASGAGALSRLSVTGARDLPIIDINLPHRLMFRAENRTLRRATAFLGRALQHRQSPFVGQPADAQLCFLTNIYSASKYFADSKQAPRFAQTGGF